MKIKTPYLQCNAQIIFFHDNYVENNSFLLFKYKLNTSRINKLTQMSKTGKSNHQMLTLAMAEFSSVDLGCMAASSYLHSTGTQIIG